MKKIVLWDALISAALAGAFLYNTIVSIGDGVERTISEAAAATLPPEPVTVTEQAMVETIDRKLELTVAELTFATSVTTGTCGETGWQRFAWNDCLTMIVPGKVEADLRLDGFNSEAIETTSDEVTIRLPGVKVGDITINHDDLQVVGYDQGLFVTDAAPNLQGQGLAEAREDLFNQACRSDLLEEATLRAADRVKNLLQPLFEAVGDTRTITVVLGSATC